MMMPADLFFIYIDLTIVYIFVVFGILILHRAARFGSRIFLSMMVRDVLGSMRA